MVTDGFNDRRRVRAVESAIASISKAMTGVVELATRKMAPHSAEAQSFLRFLDRRDRDLARAGVYAPSLRYVPTQKTDRAEQAGYLLDQADYPEDL
jgi:hypothetical protein